jgi:hypothetical protein
MLVYTTKPRLVCQDGVMECAILLDDLLFVIECHHQVD